MKVFLIIVGIIIQRDKLTEQQTRALQMLKENGLYLGEITRMEGLI